jgi:hypothetical protein
MKKIIVVAGATGNLGGKKLFSARMITIGIPILGGLL